ncbi:MAG: hypothetical protein H6Q31_1320 [Bacteroidetes bacterium]|jgi:hypothetical protein|nr:hypothetical protein [Bacteroidota bacterium]
MSAKPAAKRKSKVSTKEDLYPRLKEAYADANLNRITAALLNLYRSRDHDTLREIVHKASDVVTLDDSTLSKCFSQLVVLYHPDKGESYRREIDALHAAGRDRELSRFSHILLLENIDLLARPSPAASDTPDFTPEYAYESPDDVFDAAREEDEDAFEDSQFAPGDEEYDHTFFHALKLRLYGTLAVELPTYYLRDLEEIEMADCALTSLDGIQHCVFATVVDISGNAITDLSELEPLVRMTELFASGNQIGYIDPLRALKQLRILDLSMNDIDDVSALFDLKHLEFVNLAGNSVPANQIARLKSRGCTVLL